MEMENIFINLLKEDKDSVLMIMHSLQVKVVIVSKLLKKMVIIKMKMEHGVDVMILVINVIKVEIQLIIIVFNVLKDINSIY